MAMAYFKLVESLLQDLCKREGWTMHDGKSTCIRLQVSPWAHIDIPLYAAPEDEFPTIKDRISVEAHRTLDSAKGEASFAE
ncbi:cyclic GMP-AMP synthase DncV-like nucleotidyltransferase, partial [Enterococcus faecium]|uniref:cyclic GMP-AMP synthase DncV-like nucleotidyltransferase n=3 Tax=Bacteria TaxID=2 RepID=UPI0039FCDB1E